jgi:hypothetical protein
MKPFHIYFLKRFLFSLTFLLAAHYIFAQDMDPQTVKQLLDSKNFAFKAQSVMPASGTTRQLSSEYDLQLRGDTMIAYLPYFGRAYSPPDPTEEGGIKFTSVRYTYKMEKRKKRWEIKLTPADTKDVRELFLSVSENGYADLRITNSNRQPISYRGYIEKNGK